MITICERCQKEVATQERWDEFNEWYEASRQIDHFEFSSPPEPPFCQCCDHGVDFAQEMGCERCDEECQAILNEIQETRLRRALQSAEVVGELLFRLGVKG